MRTEEAVPRRTNRSQPVRRFPMHPPDGVEVRGAADTPLPLPVTVAPGRPHLAAVSRPGATGT
jgi:hypothetical protein